MTPQGVFIYTLLKGYSLIARAKFIKKRLMFWQGTGVGTGTGAGTPHSSSLPSYVYFFLNVTADIFMYSKKCY